MTPAQYRAMSLRAMQRAGELITLRRASATSSVRAKRSQPQRAQLTVDQLIDTANQRQRVLYVLAADLEDAAAVGGVELPPAYGDEAVLPDGTVLLVQKVDDDTQGVGGTISLYELTCVGA